MKSARAGRGVYVDNGRMEPAVVLIWHRNSNLNRASTFNLATLILDSYHTR